MSAKEQAKQEPQIWEAPNWADTPNSLDQLRRYAETQAAREIQWYAARKSPKAHASQICRFAAIVFTGIGGLAPLLASTGLFSDRLSKLSQLGYIFLALAGTLVAMDRFFGFSTGWMRYITTMLALEKAREAFRLDWAGLGRKLAAEPQSREIPEQLIQRVKDFLIEIKTHTEKETQSWITEFQSNLAQFEKDLKAQMEANRPGAIEVKITDGARTQDGFQVWLDNMMVEKATGAFASIGYVAPGLHKVTVTARSNGKELSVSRMVTVTGGAISAVELQLGADS